MPKFYSDEWLSAFNSALATFDASDVDTGASVVAESGSFRVAQIVHDVPPESPESPESPGEIRVLLSVAEGRVQMSLLDTSSEESAPNVTVRLSWADAVALSQGTLDPAGALGLGRIRVRGDLSVLVAGQAVMASASAHLAALQESTTY